MLKSILEALRQLAMPPDILSAKSQLVSDKNGSKFELAQLCELCLAEYASARKEIELRLDFEERTIGNLLILIGGLVTASQLFDQQTNKLLAIFQANPASYLVLACLGLVFPFSILQHNLYVASLGSYIRDVLAPKINGLIQLDSSEVRSRYTDWESSQFPAATRGMMRWEEYRIETQFREAGLVFGAMVTFRYLFAASPTLVLVYMFFKARPGTFWTSWTLWDQFVFVTACLFVVAILVGVFRGVIGYTHDLRRMRTK